jgi:hypothetical protein
VLLSPLAVAANLLNDFIIYLADAGILDPVQNAIANDLEQSASVRRTIQCCTYSIVWLLFV